MRGEVSLRNEKTSVFWTARRFIWSFIEKGLNLKCDWKMLKTMDTAVVYLKTSRTELVYRRGAISQSWLGSQQCRNLHYFHAHLRLAPRKCFFTLQPSRTFNSSEDYARLGLPTKASRAEIKSAYFSLAKKLHPDNGGDARQFNEVISCFQSSFDGISSF